MDIYVGNLPWKLTQEEIETMFEAHGTVDKATIVADRETGKSKGFGFVVMPNEEEANAAIAELNEKEVLGRVLKVNKARPKEPKEPSDR